MSENYQRSVGVPKAYKKDRGYIPAETGPFIGEVTNNVDPTRSGRLQVYIEYLAGPDKNDQSLWRTVSYISPYYGVTQQSEPQRTGPGTFIGNNQSYGMWGTVPDLGTKVLCFFANGDPNQGYYVGMPIEPGINHMLPAIGSQTKYVDDSNSPYLANKSKLPVTEINNTNTAISEDPRFFTKEKPVHSVLASQMLNQGVIDNQLLGPIESNSQRESPSTVFGISTPGRPVRSGGLTDVQFVNKLNKSELTPTEARVIARKGGHTFVMDDGNLKGEDNLVRIRTAGGHQIMMNDTGETIHIMHANGQTWIELGKEGTVDVYASNSMNIRSQGELNLHATKNININSEDGSVNLFSKNGISMESKTMSINTTDNLIAYSKKTIGIKSDGSLAIKSSAAGSWGASSLTFEGSPIKLNSGAASDVAKPQDIPKNRLPDTKFQDNVGWVVEQNKIETVVSRAPTHEPFPFHGTGVNTSTNFAGGAAEIPLEPKTQQAVDKAASANVEKISSADYETQPSTDTAVGKIQPNETKAMLAQASKQVPQVSTAISNDKGAGKFGLSAAQLEKTGLLKPGTTDFYLKDATSDLTTVLNNPSVWSGNQGCNNLQDFLGNESLQDFAQTDLLNQGLSELQSLGVVTGLENNADLAGLVQGAAKFGGEAVQKWTQGAATLGQTFAGSSTSPITSTQMDEFVRGGQYAVDLAIQKLPAAVQGFNTAISNVNNTALRSNIDSATESVIHSEKVKGRQDIGQ